MKMLTSSLISTSLIWIQINENVCIDDKNEYQQEKTQLVSQSYAISFAFIDKGSFFKQNKSGIIAWNLNGWLLQMMKLAWMNSSPRII